MLNAIANGRRIDVKVTTNPVVSGVLTRNNGILGIPSVNGIVGNTVAFHVEGVNQLTVNIGGTLNVGTYLYWDVSAAALSIGAASDDIFYGQIVGVVSASDKTYYVHAAKGPQPPRTLNQS